MRFWARVTYQSNICVVKGLIISDLSHSLLAQSEGAGDHAELIWRNLMETRNLGKHLLPGSRGFSCDIYQSPFSTVHGGEYA